MLVLSRKTSETILIGEDIVVSVIQVYGPAGNPSVKLGIQAPRDVRVDRPEVRLKVLADQDQQGA